jgi:hypothetical protein
MSCTSPAATEEERVVTAAREVFHQHVVRRHGSGAGRRIIVLSSFCLRSVRKGPPAPHLACDTARAGSNTRDGGVAEIHGHHRLSGSSSPSLQLPRTTPSMDLPTLSFRI